PRMRILVTDGNTRAALAITRSLGRAGHDVLVGANTLRSLAGSSRHCRARVCYPDPDRYGPSFVDFIGDYIAHEAVDVLLPVTDITLLTIGANRARIPAHCAMPFPDLDTVKTVADKAAMMALADRLGVDIPRSVTVAAATDSAATEHGLSFPLVIKPFKSRVATKTDWIYTAVTYAHDAADLQQLLGGLDPRIFPVLLQEKIVGPGMGVCICAHRGTVLAAFAHQRLREKPPSGGVSVLRESVALDPLAFEFAARMLDELNWHGVAMVEFKQDLRDGRPKLMEINGRFWGSLQLAIDAGVDFPRILVDSLSQPAAQPLVEYRTGVRTRWLWGDIDALMLRLFRTAAQLDLPPYALSKPRYLADFMTSFVDPATRLEVERLNDPKPAVYEMLEWLGRVLKPVLPSA
ncbi:MAG: ATP-grasp domain-containing protein, partial [Gammaproteobacteria bacterium]|nr:ATP-grasp domain-containing protein [Gammaproteobacteria bacterium]